MWRTDVGGRMEGMEAELLYSDSIQAKPATWAEEWARGDSPGRAIFSFIWIILSIHWHPRLPFSHLVMLQDHIWSFQKTYSEERLEQWWPWSQTITVTNVLSVMTNEEEIIFFQLWKKDWSGFSVELSPGSPAPQQRLEMWVLKRRDALVPEEEDFRHIPLCSPIFY